MDFTRYPELKADGRITLTRVDSKTIIVAEERYDQASGDQIESQITPATQTSINSLEKQKDELQEKIDGINAFLTDYAAVP
jgi:hypothetical protein